MRSMGITQWFLNSPQGPESLRAAHELGFDCIHINAGLPSDQWCLEKPEVERAYMEMVENFNIQITAISINLIEKHGLLVFPSFELEPALKRAIQNTIWAAQRLNVRLVYFPSFNQSQINNHSDFNKMIKILQYACDIANQSNVQIATENTLSAIENTTLFQNVDRPNLKLLLDTLNPILYGHSILEIVDALFPFIADQVHVKDGMNGKLGNVRLGYGEAGLHNTFARLYEKGFNGDFILENDYLECGHDLIAKDLELLSSIIYEVLSRRKYVLH